MAQATRKIIVTSALIYANGPLHLGHLVELIQTDIWARFQRLRGHDCNYICGNDAHGTPIMLRAQKEGIAPEKLVERIAELHQQDIQDFHIQLGSYLSTHTDTNKKLVEDIYFRLQKNNDLTSKTIAQAYDPKQEMFLPDRYVKGECPRCHAQDQYGDSCEHCGATYTPLELINPKSVISGSTPIEKTSEHLFFPLQKYYDVLHQWTRQGHLQAEITNKLDEWFGAGLQPWDVSRDAPYFGFEIPEHPQKYFYVWLDAPIGYMASYKTLCDRDSQYNFDEYWHAESKTELYHFVGKDIVYFHALFWPAILKSANYRLPTAVFAHGFLTIDGQKMSKSRGTFILARRYLQHLNPECLRYYFAGKLNSHVQDIDLNWDDFQQRVNSDLVGKVVNIASRCAGFINKNFANTLSTQLANQELFDHAVTAGDKIAEAYEARDYNRAVRLIMEIADRVNQYIDEQKPWTLNKQNPADPLIQEICTVGLNLFRLLIFYLQPILPAMAEASAQFLNSPIQHWQQRSKPLLAHTLNIFTPLLQRIDKNNLEAMKAAASEDVV